MIKTKEGEMKVTVRPIKKFETHPWLLEKHYAKRIPSISYAFGLYYENILTGVCTFGSGANRNAMNMIKGFTCIELNRLIIDDQGRKNALSHFVAECLGKLPRPLVIVSYADPNKGHNGYIYQATNWIYTGQGTRRDGGTDSGVTLFRKNGKEYHGRSVKELIGSCATENAEKHGFVREFTPPKHRYFFFLGTKKEKKKMLSDLPYPITPYPKGANKRYDASAKVSTQLFLF